MVLIALHTYGIGVGLLVVPEWALRFGGWETIPPLFFPRQAACFTWFSAPVTSSSTPVALRLTPADGQGLRVRLPARRRRRGRVPWFVTFAGDRGRSDGPGGAWAADLAVSRAGGTGVLRERLFVR